MKGFEHNKPMRVIAPLAIATLVGLLATTAGFAQTAGTGSATGMGTGAGSTTGTGTGASGSTDPMSEDLTKKQSSAATGPNNITSGASGLGNSVSGPAGSALTKGMDGSASSPNP